MKKITFLAAVAAMFCTVACNKNLDTQTDQIPEPQTQEQRYDLTVGFGNKQVQTKAYLEWDHSSIHRVQVYVFRADGYLDAHYREYVANLDDGQPRSSITLKCVAGTHDVYVLLNGPERTFGTKTEFLAALADLTAELNSGAQYIGHTSATVPSNDAVQVEVHRLTAQVKINKISLAFPAGVYTNQTFKLSSLFLSNVAGNGNLGEDSVPTVWYSKQGFESGVPQNTYYGFPTPVTLANNASRTYAWSFLAFPNVAEDSQAATWCPRHTRLVVKALIGETETYYPITLPVLEPGKSYIIEELTITRMGSSDPDKPITLADCNFQIKIKDWDEVEVSDGITI